MGVLSRKRRLSWRPCERPNLAEFARQLVPRGAGVARTIDLAADAARIQQRWIGRVHREVPDCAVGAARHLCGGPGRAAVERAYDQARGPRRSVAVAEED